jgi:hypothetical protein
MWGQSGVNVYQVETSTDNVTWSLMVNKSGNTSAAQIQRDDFTGTARYVRITFTSSGYISTLGIYEFRVFN